MVSGRSFPASNWPYLAMLIKNSSIPDVSGDGAFAETDAKVNVRTFADVVLYYTDEDPTNPDNWLGRHVRTVAEVLASRRPRRNSIGEAARFIQKGRKKNGHASKDLR